jgi:hypothetical protein
MKLSRDKDIATAEDIINQMVSEGWNLQQIITANPEPRMFHALTCLP